MTQLPKIPWYLLATWTMYNKHFFMKCFFFYIDSKFNGLGSQWVQLSTRKLSRIAPATTESKPRERNRIQENWKIFKTNGSSSFGILMVYIWKYPVLNHGFSSAMVEFELLQTSMPSPGHKTCRKRLKIIMSFIINVYLLFLFKPDCMFKDWPEQQRSIRQIKLLFQSARDFSNMKSV